MLFSRSIYISFYLHYRISLISLPVAKNKDLLSVDCNCDINLVAVGKGEH